MGSITLLQRLRELGETFSHWIARLLQKNLTQEQPDGGDAPGGAGEGHGAPTSTLGVPPRSLNPVPRVYGVSITVRTD